MTRKTTLSPREMTIFAMLGALMFCGKLIMEFVPNVHPLGLLVMTYTVVYRRRAIIPIIVYLLLQGIYAGFNLWWIPYLYLWPLLWGVTMLLPKNMPAKRAMVVYPIVCALFGLCYGTLYSPAQAIMFGLNFKGMITWIIAGLPYDIIHCIGNLAAGLLVLPLSKLLKKLDANHYS